MDDKFQPVDWVDDCNKNQLAKNKNQLAKVQ